MTLVPIGALAVSIHLILPPNPSRILLKTGLFSAINFRTFYSPPRASIMPVRIRLYSLGTHIS